MTNGERPSKKAAKFISDLTFDDLPSESVWLAERCFVDTIGVILAGSNENGAGKVAIDTLEEMSRKGDGGSRIIGSNSTAGVSQAALANSTAGHALDFDDSTPAVPAHLSVTAIPSILAIADDRQLNGTEAITAYIAGFETAYHLSRSICPEHYQQGWHATGTVGTFCAAAAAANALQLDYEQTTNTLNAVASMTAGLRENFGTMTKPLHAGHAAQAGVIAAFLSKNGLTASETAIDGDQGFVELYGGGDSSPQDAFSKIGELWGTIEEGVDVKKYPCCHAAHAAIAATESIISENSISPKEIQKVSVIGSPISKEILSYERPETGLEAKFSLHYTVASAVIYDRVGIKIFRDDVVNNTQVRSIIDKINFEVDPDLPYQTHQTTVEITTKEGSKFRNTRKNPPGTHSNPLSESELREKFLMCATLRYSERTADNIYEKLTNLRNRDRICDILPEV